VFAVSSFIASGHCFIKDSLIRRWIVTVAFILLFVVPTGESACVQGQPATADCALQTLTFS
jgi:hypothetical protein